MSRIVLDALFVAVAKRYTVNFLVMNDYGK